MTRTLLLGPEEALPVDTGTATSFTQASAVRLVIVDPGAAHTVTVVVTQSGNDIGSMTMPGGSVETLEKTVKQDYNILKFIL